MKRLEMIEKLNNYFPSYEARNGKEFGKGFENAIWFVGENAYANLFSDHDENGVYVYEHVVEKGCPVNVFLENNGWYVKAYDFFGGGVSS